MGTGRVRAADRATHHGPTVAVPNPLGRRVQPGDGMESSVPAALVPEEMCESFRCRAVFAPDDRGVVHDAA